MLCCVTMCSAALVGIRPVVADTLWSHVRQASDLRDVRAARVHVDPSIPGGRLTLKAAAGATHAWAIVPPPASGWSLDARATVEATLTNRGPRAVKGALWVVAAGGWESIADFAEVDPGATRTFVCRLRESFPDGTPKLDPARVQGIQVMLERPAAGQEVEVTGLVAEGEAPPWTRPAGRIEVPVVEAGEPAPGRRVWRRFGPEGEAAGAIHLPRDWRDGGRYPVIVEYPGNIFYTSGCYSTGRPEQCVIGFGMSRDEGAIWLSLPFVDAAGGIAENGWGDPDATADLCVRAVEDVCTRFAGDRTRLVLAGFSRGAIACGYIGLRNERIAGLWRGLHCCQHFDGDGWNGATMEGAVERAARFRGRAVFHTDNRADDVRPVTDALGVPVEFVSSGLGAHSCAMFLDDRPSTRRLRNWFNELVGPSGAALPDTQPNRIMP